MTYEQLLVLHTIVTEGTFRAAAQKLYKSQPAVSHMLKKLEDDIGIVLVSRDAYRPVLTPAGEVFYRQATKVLHQMQSLRSTAKQLSNLQEAEITLVITATYPIKPLLKVISNLSRLYPSTHIKLLTEAMGGPLERLISNQADIIIATMDAVPTEEVEALPFASINIIPVAHPDFEPAKSSHMKSLSEMQSYVQVVVAGSSKSQKFDQSRGLLPGGLRWTVSDFSAKKEVLLAKMGWGGMPEHTIDQELKTGQLVSLDIEAYPTLHSQLYQMRKRDQEIGLVAQALWQQLSDNHKLVLKT